MDLLIFTVLVIYLLQLKSIYEEEYMLTTNHKLVPRLPKYLRERVPLYVMKPFEKYLPSFHALSMNKKSSPDPD